MSREEQTDIRLTPSLHQPLKCPGWMIHGHASKQHIFRSYNICFQCYAFWWRSCHIPVRKKKTKKVYGFEISNFYGSFSNDIMAMKGLIVSVWNRQMSREVQRNNIRLTTLLLQPVKCPGWKVLTYMPADSMFDGSYNKTALSTVHFDGNPFTYSDEGRFFLFFLYIF